MKDNDTTALVDKNKATELYIAALYVCKKLSIRCKDFLLYYHFHTSYSVIKLVLIKITKL